MQLSPRRGGGGGGGEGEGGWGRLDITNVFVHVSLSRIALAESARETVSLLRLGMLSTRFLLSRARDCTTFTFHDSTDFYLESMVERVTAHRIKINDNSCFYNRWSNSKKKLKHL